MDIRIEVFKITEQIRILKNERNKINSKINDLENLLEAVRNTCEHEFFKYLAHDTKTGAIKEVCSMCALTRNA
jgi:uncharacterized coiled-coil DUF342 family protein